eukprot:2425924-Rhodomonas_salina.1
MHRYRTARSTGIGQYSMSVPGIAQGFRRAIGLPTRRSCPSIAATPPPPGSSIAWIRTAHRVAQAKGLGSRV